MLTFRSPQLTSRRRLRGWTRPWWVIAGWLVALLVVLPLTLVVLGVHYEWFSHPSVLYTLHDEIYLPLRGWLVLQPWPFCLIPWGFAVGMAGALAAPFLFGRSPLKQAYLWCARAILIVLSRLPQRVTQRFLAWWSRWGRARHAAWPLLADEIRMSVLRRFDAHPHKRAWWLAELVRWTTLTLQLRRVSVTPAEEETAGDRVGRRAYLEQLTHWLRGETVLADSLECLQNLPHRLWRGIVEPATINSQADTLSRRDRIRNAQAWTEAVVRLAAVSTGQAALDQAGRPALLSGQWQDVFRRGDGTLRERAALAWYLIRQQPNLEELVAWLQRDAADCVPEDFSMVTLEPDKGAASLYGSRNGDASGHRCGLDFDSAARDLALLVPLLSELARRTGIEAADADAPAIDSHPPESNGSKTDVARQANGEVLAGAAVTFPDEKPLARDGDGDRHSRLKSLSPESRRRLRTLTARTMQRRQFIEQTLRELEAHAFHSFAAVLPADRVPLEADPEVGALCLNLALIPVMLTGEAGPLTGLVEAIDAFHLMWSLSAGRLASAPDSIRPAVDHSHPIPATWSDLHAALGPLPGTDVRNYCRETLTELFGTAAAAVSESVLHCSSIVRESDLNVLRDRAALVDRVSARS